MKNFLQNPWVITIVGTMVGVLGAFLLNAWGIKREARALKAEAIEKMSNEVAQNRERFSQYYQRLDSLIPPFSSLVENYLEEDEVKMTPAQMSAYQKEHPNFIQITDSTPLPDGRFIYNGDLELPVLSLITVSLTESAWKTSQITDVLKGMDFDCISNIEQMYDLQQVVQEEYQAALDQLRDDNMEGFVNSNKLLLTYAQALMDQYDQFETYKTDCL